MTASLIVRRRDIESTPPPTGGTFARRAVARVPVPAILADRFGIFCVDTSERVLALTYDDGPHPEDTPRLLDELAAHGARATFFVLSGQVERHPAIARRLLTEGHELALHGPDHRSLTTMDDRAAVEHVRRARDTVEQITSSRLRLYRPPYGEHTPRQARGIARLGLDVVIWSADSLDWQPGTAEEIAGRVIASVFPGGIVLLHDNRGDPETAGAGEGPPADRVAVLRRMLAGLDAHGYRAETVGALLAAHPPVRSWARERMVRR